MNVLYDTPPSCERVHFRRADLDDRLLSRGANDVPFPSPQPQPARLFLCDGQVSPPLASWAAAFTVIDPQDPFLDLQGVFHGDPVVWGLPA